LKATTAEQRREIGRLGAAARCQRAASLRVTPLADPAALQVWIDTPPHGAPE
jgi:hypothetical protein